MHTYQKYIAYNAWANGQFADLLANLPDSVLDAPVKSSFDTLRKTVFHLLDAEIVWLERLHGRSVEGWPSEQMKPAEFAGELKKSAHAWEEWGKQQDETSWKALYTYKNLKGVEFHTSAADIMMHCMNHATFHRGQLVTMLRELNAVDTIPKTDYIQYCRDTD